MRFINDTAVLEIKTYGVNFDKMGDQLFYETNGRDCYIMQIEWSIKKMTFVISKVKFEIDNSLPRNSLESRIENFKNRIANKQIDVVKYVNSYSRDFDVRCVGIPFSKSYNAMLKRSECPRAIHLATPKKRRKSKTSVLSAEEKQINRTQKIL